MNTQFNNFQKLVNSKFKFRLYLLAKLPMAFFSGLQVKKLNEHSATVIVKHKWINQNPFRSMYFAVMSMAAELSTGILANGNVYKRNPTVSMLIVNLKASFYKKAVGVISFECYDGKKITEAVETAIQTNEPSTVICTSVGFNEQGEKVAEFLFEWSFKQSTTQRK